MPVKRFELNPARVRQLRTDMRMSAEAMALALRAKLGNPTDTSSERKVHSATSTYQKIERTGKTSLKTAQALAEIFEITLGAIKGDEPVDAFKRLQALLGKKLADPKLDRLRQQHATLRKQSPGLDPDKILEYLAEDIGERLEAAQLLRDASEFDDLSVLLDTPIDELKKPIFVRGHWWITTSGYENFDGFVVSGVSTLLREIRRLALAFPFMPGDHRRITITLSRRQLKYRLQVEIFGISRRPDWIEWVRCEPNGDVGLRWSHPPEWEDHCLRTTLREFAFANANVVRDLDNRQTPEDPRNLYLRVTTQVRTEGSNWEISNLVRLRGYVEDLPEEMFAGWEEVGSLESILLATLQQELQEFLHPHLQHDGAEHWDVHGSRPIVLTLKRLWPTPIGIPEPRAVRQYEIELMTTDRAGQETPSPWKTGDIQRLTAAIKSWIPEPSLRTGGSGEASATGQNGRRQ